MQSVRSCTMKSASNAGGGCWCAAWPLKFMDIGHVLVAQLDRASPSEGEGWWFDPTRGYLREKTFSAKGLELSFALHSFAHMGRRRLAGAARCVLITCAMNSWRNSSLVASGRAC